MLIKPLGQPFTFDNGKRCERSARPLCESVTRLGSANGYSEFGSKASAQLANAVARPAHLKNESSSKHVVYQINSSLMAFRAIWLPEIFHLSDNLGGGLNCCKIFGSFESGASAGVLAKSLHSGQWVPGTPLLTRSNRYKLVHNNQGSADFD